MSAHAWVPFSPCGTECAGDPEPVVPVPRRVLRAVLALLVLVCAAVLFPVAVVAGGGFRRALCRGLCRWMLRALGVRLELTGDAGFLDTSVPRGSLVVSNHVSWLDTLAVSSVRPMRALGKVQIRSWPLVGVIAARIGTLFVDRDSLRSLPSAVSALTEVLRAEGTVYVTPEGTTWCGYGAGPFKPAVFQAAIDGGVPVRPIALRYRVSERTTAWPSFVGDETLVDSLARVLRLRGLVLEIHVRTEIAPGSTADRRELASLAENAVHAPSLGGASPDRWHALSRVAPGGSALERTACPSTTTDPSTTSDHSTATDPSTTTDVHPSAQQDA